MKRIKIFGIIIACTLVFFIVFFFFNVPEGSVEGRVSRVSEIFKYHENQDSVRLFKEYFEKYSKKERLEIFENMSFQVIKDNRIWLTKYLDGDLPEWRNLDCFNTTYLMTEVELDEKRNMRVIKNMKPATLKAAYSSYDEIISDVYSLAFKSWGVGKGDFYVVDGSLDAKLSFVDGKSTLNYLNIKVFSIETAYVFSLRYADSNLQLVPLDEKFDDNGAFELGEKLKFYECDRIFKYLKSTLKLMANNYTCILKDKYIDSKKTDSTAPLANEVIDLLYNRDFISRLDEKTSQKYVGSIVFEKASANEDAPSEDKEKQDEENKNLAVPNKLDSQVYSKVNLFKSN